MSNFIKLITGFLFFGVVSTMSYHDEVELHTANPASSFETVEYMRWGPAPLNYSHQGLEHVKPKK